MVPNSVNRKGQGLAVSSYTNIESKPLTGTIGAVSLSETFSAIFGMCKFRMILMVWVTEVFGYLLATQFVLVNLPVLLMTLVFSGVAAGGSFILNQYLEIDVDMKMVRTERRALPQGIISASTALWLGLSLMFLGLLGLQLFVGFLPMILTALIGGIYVWVYTPLKRVTWLNTTVGAISGALPPVVGWAAATGSVNSTAWLLFAVMFVWQHPHFFAIGWLYRDDYRNGGIKILPVSESGFWTSVQTIFFATLLIPLTWTLYFMELTGRFYMAGITICGFIFLAQSIRFSLKKNDENARRLLFGSLMYLPLFLVLLSLDSNFSF